MRNDQICPEDEFRRLVDFRYCDMNNISSDLHEFDFCWSCCALEHLGSLSAGLRFIERSLDTLRPGGWAVHTTEFNLFSDAAQLRGGRLFSIVNEILNGSWSTYKGKVTKVRHSI